MSLFACSSLLGFLHRFVKLEKALAKNIVASRQSIKLVFLEVAQSSGKIEKILYFGE
jgi:hypothetical protein